MDITALKSQRAELDRQIEALERAAKVPGRVWVNVYDDDRLALHRSLESAYRCREPEGAHTVEALTLPLRLTMDQAAAAFAEFSGTAAKQGTYGSCIKAFLAALSIPVEIVEASNGE